MVLIYEELTFGNKSVSTSWEKNYVNTSWTKIESRWLKSHIKKWGIDLESWRESLKGLNKEWWEAVTVPFWGWSFWDGQFFLEGITEM